MDGLGHGIGDDIPWHRLEQPQDLDKLALALGAHARLEQMAQMLEHLGQVPVLQRRRLVERVRLHLNQRQVMQRIGDEGALGIGPRMPGDDLAGTKDYNLVDEALYHDFLEAVARRHRVVVVAVANQRRRRHAAAALLAGLQRHRRQRAQRRRVGHQSLADRLGMATGVVGLASAAAHRQHRIEIIEARRLRDRHHEVRP